MQKGSYDIFSDFEGTIGVPKISYKEWVKARSPEPTKSKIEDEFNKRMGKVSKVRTAESWADYLVMYSGLLTSDDFEQIASKYSLNSKFEWWCKRYLTLHGYSRLNLNVITRGFAPIAKLYFRRNDVRKTFSEMKVLVSKIVGSEPLMEKGTVFKGLKSVVYMKRKFVKDGHFMLGDDEEESEFAGYSYFVNISGSENT